MRPSRLEEKAHHWIIAYWRRQERIKGFAAVIVKLRDEPAAAGLPTRRSDKPARGVNCRFIKND